MAVTKRIENKDKAEWISLASSAGKASKTAKRIAELASRPKRQMVAVNLDKIDMLAEDGSDIVVPGKVLGVGSISKKFRISAISYSSSAQEKLKRGGCEIVEIGQMLKKDKIKVIM
jgi:large subunit ribosomal protein L18e